MRRNNRLLKIVTMFTVFSVGASLAIHLNVTPKRVDAAQHLSNFDSYTYSGSYYDSINFDTGYGMNGSLRTSLTSLIKPAGFYTYSSDGETHLATQLQYADEDPTNSNNMIYLYTRDSVKKNSASSWNREHVWPQSLSNGNWGTSQGGTDILHIRPTYSSTNSSRGNLKYGNNNKSGAKYYQDTMLYGYAPKGATYFEPVDAVKGDVARIIMYMWITYTGWSGYSSLNILNVFESYDTLLSWHTSDQPDVMEGNRNNYVQTSRQKNRNPFVDHPELAWKIFGDSASTSVKNACMAAYPASGTSGDPIDPTGISLNKNSANLDAGRTLQLSASLQPSGATGTISWSSNNTTVATVSNSGLVTAKAAGTATITASVNSFTANCVITVTEAVNNYGTLENPLSIEDAKEILDINGTSETNSPIYVKGIVSSNTAYNTTYSNYDNVWLQSDDGKTTQAFQLFRVKLDSSITGDYTAKDSMKGLEVVGYGYGKIYNGDYELTTSSNTPKNPLILSISTPAATDITLDMFNAEVKVGNSIKITATLTPSNSESPITWESSDESVATVNNNGLVTGVSAGTSVITASVPGGIEEECVVTVTANSSSESTLEVTKSITAGDTVYLAANAVSMQYNGPSTTSTIYGYGVEFDETPSTNVCALEVATGSVDNSYAFKIKDNNSYLAWSSGNSLKTVNSINGNSSWLVSFDADGNATIANASTTSRVIWWNVSSPRFACYEDKTDGNSYKYVQLWKVNSSTTVDPLDYLDTASKFANIYGNESVDVQSSVVSVTFSEAGLTNGQAVTSLNIDSSVTLTANKANGSNDPAYYDNGSNLRIYNKNILTFASTKNITKIQFTFTTNYSTGLTVSMGALNNGVWTGDADSVTFTNGSSSQVRITAVEVTYGKDEISVNSVALEFGTSIAKDKWDAIADEYEISEFGIMLFKTRQASVPTVEEVFNATPAKTVVINNTQYGVTLDEDGDNYSFSVKVNISSEANYVIYFCAAPYVVVDGDYHFLSNMKHSVKTLAQEYLGTNYQHLSQVALNKLAGN